MGDFLTLCSGQVGFLDLQKTGKRFFLILGGINKMHAKGGRRRAEEFHLLRLIGGFGEDGNPITP